MSLMVQRRETTLVRQKEIIDAARKLIIKYGSEHVTVKRIAKEVGFTEGAIYRHFKSKRDILSFLADHIEEDLMGDIEAGTGSGSLHSLEAVLSKHLSAIAQRKGVSFQVIAEIISLGDKKLNKKISETIGKYTSRIKDILSDGVKAGEIRPDIDLDAAAAMFFGMVQGLVSIWTLSNHSSSLEERRTPLWNIFREAVIKR